MKNSGKRERISNRYNSVNRLTTKFHDPHALDFLDQFLRQETYSREFCEKLLGVARQKPAAWDLRRLAVLMLEHQILKLPHDHLADFDFLLSQLNLKTLESNDMTPSVLKEGYSTTAFHDFIPQFRDRLSRLSYVHGRIKGRKTPDAALRDFIELSGEDCKLTLARYLFTPAEVVDEILRQLEVSNGVSDLSMQDYEFGHQDIARAISVLPDFEAGILKRLTARSNIYWVSEATSSQINSLVEYPLTTVVLVIKPPGSEIEFEIKRAGLRGPNPLSVVYARRGYAVPPSHRLSGGNMLWLLQYEAMAAGKLAAIYRLVHKVEPPIPYYVSRSTVFSVPGRKSDVQTLPYFTDPQLFGPGFREMRAAMKESVRAFKAEGNELLPDLAGDLGLTAQFIGHVSPAQAILCGTSSLRLDKLAEYLSAQGPEKYFSEGLGVAYTKSDERQLADQLLDEVLGVYQAPNVSYRNYEQYLKGAFRIAENRSRADQVYLSIIAQLFRFWGTLLAVGGYSRGESFVARNVGLKSSWEQGEWKVKIILMDHDALMIPGPEDRHFYAKGALPNMFLDESFLWRRSNRQINAPTTLGRLQRIYRIGSEVDAEGQTLACAVLKDAYKKTQHEVLTNPRLRPLFSKTFIDRLLVWDTLVEGYFQMNGDKSVNAKWKKQMKRLLAAKGYGKPAFDELTKTIEANRHFLERYLFLFDVASAVNSQ